jgi:hypothetical protein
VLVERVRGGQLVIEPVLEFSACADQLAGVPITFGHIKPVGLERLGISIGNLLGAGGLKYNAAFDIDGRALVGDIPVTFGIAGSEGGGGLFEDSGLFSDEGSANETGGPAEGEATAEWLQVRHTPPSGEPVTSRRTVFDRLPPEQRFGGEPSVDSITAIELIGVDGSNEVDFAPMLSMRSFAVVTSVTPGSSLVARATRSGSSGLASMALAYHYLRDVLATEIVLDHGMRLFIDAPNIMSVSMAVTPRQPEPLVSLSLDIWHRNSGRLSLAGDVRPSSQPRLVAGVLGHVVERVAADQGAGQPGDDPVGSIGVGQLFEAATRAGIPIVTISGSVPSEVDYGVEATALMEEALAAGAVVVAPSEPVVMGGRDRVGWWRIDPVTGATVDVMDDGSGSEVTEYQLPLTWEFRAASCLFALSGSILAGVVEILDLGGLNDAKHGVSIASIIFQSFSAARGWTGACK